jgi:hypothetical protein
VGRKKEGCEINSTIELILIENELQIYKHVKKMNNRKELKT